MHVARPIVSVIPSLDGPVLAALAGTSAPLNLSSVHRLAASGSLSGVRRVLLRLVDTGLVDAVPGGYLLNRDHVAAPAVEGLARLWSAVAERIHDHVQAWQPAPLLVGLYGSAARRDGDERSDIDVVLVSDAEDAADRAAELALRIERWAGNPTHITTVGTADLRRMRRARETILREWERDLVVVVGKREALRGAS